MTHKERICLGGALAGAVAGAAVAYLYGTDDGARRRLEIGRTIDRLTIDAEEAKRLWQSLKEAWARFERERPRAALGTRTWPPGGAA